MSDRRLRRLGWATVVVAVAAVVLLAYWRFSEREKSVEVGFGPSPAMMLSRDNDNSESYARVLGPREFSFPADHGPHDAYKTEWWYFTGNLDDLDGRRFGYELAFFRFALAPRPVSSGSAWRSNQLYMAHFALTDVENDRFHSFERFSREALGLAGVTRDQLHVWLYDWLAASNQSAAFPLTLHAAADGIAIDLTLNSGKPMVLHGQAGFSRKSSEIGQASYYYSFTRLPTAGTIQIDGRTVQVQGDSWMDREWSTSALSEEQAGWDWFALQLSDGRDLMFYRLRRKDGTVDPLSAGTLVQADGTAQPLGHEAVRIRERGEWRSPRTGALYPAEWQLSLPEYEIELVVEPVMSDQELDVSFKYWEGAVNVHGTSSGEPVSGRGYVELTGYAESADEGG
jgi:predicted secreted hydrolase